MAAGTQTRKIVTLRDTPTSNGASTTPRTSPHGPKTGAETSTLQLDPVALRDQTMGLLRKTRDYWVPPALLTKPPPTVRDLADYARNSPWTAKSDGPIRRLGILWHLTIGLPITVACRYLEWIAQRPSRAITVLGLWELLIHTGAGPWISTNIIHPVLGLAAWILL